MNTSAGTGAGGGTSGYHHNKKTGGLDLWEVSKKSFLMSFEILRKRNKVVYLKSLVFNV